MKVRVAYTAVVDDDYRRAIRHHYGAPGLATREEVRRWLEEYGSCMDTDLYYDLRYADDERNDAP